MAESPISTPIRRIRSGCCARAVSGQSRRATEQRDELAPIYSITSSAREQHGWHGKAKGLGGNEVDDEVELGRLLDWDVAWLRAAQYLVDASRPRAGTGPVCSLRRTLALHLRAAPGYRASSAVGATSAEVLM